MVKEVRWQFLPIYITKEIVQLLLKKKYSQLEDSSVS